MRRLVKYMLGTGGQAIFIENGIEKKRPGEAGRRGPGVFVLDTASGAVLRNDVAFTRVIGPGLTFTSGSEYLAGAVDLHRQTQPIPALGPLGNEDPFASRRREETDEEYQQRQVRRLETSGLTRDGVEVVPNFSVTFRLEGFEPAVEGRLERTWATARVGRGGSARIARDHDSDWFEARIPSGAREIRLERAQGLAGAPLRVALYRVWLPHGAAWVLALVVLALAAAGEVLAGVDHGSAIAAGAALGFGLVVGYNVTPASAVVPSLWAIVLGAIVGAPLAVVFRLVARRALAGRPARERGKPRPKG
jgi:hypothetical protein